MHTWIHKLKKLLARWDASPADHGETALVRYLKQQISDPDRAKSVLNTVDRFQKQSDSQQQEELPSIYLLLEQYLTEVDTGVSLTKSLLRRRIRDRFPQLLASDEFRLIFEEPARQELLLTRRLILSILERAISILGTTKDRLLFSLQEWMVDVPDAARLPVPLDTSEQLPDTDGSWVELLTRLADRLYWRLEETLGEATDRLYKRAYQDLAEQYSGLETFSVVVRLLPDKLLDKEQLQLLSYNKKLLNRDKRLKAVEQELSVRNQELQQTRSALQAVLNTVGEAIVTIDATGTVVLGNDEVFNVWGFRREELMGKPFTLLIPGPRPVNGEVVHQFMNERVPNMLGERVELEGQTKKGEVFPLEMRITETRIDERLFFTCAMREITERKQFEAELIKAKETAEEMNQLKSTFLANMSHEIRTPITSILGFTEVLKEELNDANEFLDLIHRSGQRLMNMLNSVLDMSQLQANIMKLDVSRVDISREVEEAVELFSPAAKSKSLRLQAELPDKPVWAYTDPSFIHRIANNLISNAVKFTEEGQITVRVASKEDRVVIQVEDTGIGIQEEFLPQLFDAFEQASSGLQRTHTGAGLGLAITKQLVDLIQGTISVESAVGEGTIFSVEIPCRILASMKNND